MVKSLYFVSLKMLKIQRMTSRLIGSSLRCHTNGPLAERLIHKAHKMGKTLGVSKSLFLQDLYAGLLS